MGQKKVLANSVKEEKERAMNFVHICEILMLVLFGASWPFNIAKSIRSRTAKGKSLIFEALIICGYLCGLAAKIYIWRQTGVLAYSTWFYIADIAMVATDLALSIRNVRLDRVATAK